MRLFSDTITSSLPGSAVPSGAVLCRLAANCLGIILCGMKDVKAEVWGLPESKTFQSQDEPLAGNAAKSPHGFPVALFRVKGRGSWVLLLRALNW